MTTVVLGEPPPPLAVWLAQRRELGQDLYDEVWDGEYHVVPAAHSNHGEVQGQVTHLLWQRARQVGLWPSAPANIGGPTDYRVPDGVVFRDRDAAVFRATAAVVYEIVSPNDESYAKFGFYFDRGVEELLVVDPARRTVEWYTRGPDAFVRGAGSALLGVTEAELTAEIDWPAPGRSLHRSSREPARAASAQVPGPAAAPGPGRTSISSASMAPPHSEQVTAGVQWWPHAAWTRLTGGPPGGLTHRSPHAISAISTGTLAAGVGEAVSVPQRPLLGRRPATTPSGCSLSRPAPSTRRPSRRWSSCASTQPG